MALISCPECNSRISDTAQTCPHCGYAIRVTVNDVIRIKIDRYPTGQVYTLTIKEIGTDRHLAFAKSGAVTEIKSSRDIQIGFYGLTNTPMITTVVSPKNGGKYHAVWGPGFFSPKIVSCSRVDYIDS